MKRKNLILVAALIPIIMIPFTGLTWVIFSIYCFLVYFRKFSQWYSKIPMDSRVKFFLFSLLFGMITEVFAVVDNLPKPPWERILLNSDPVIDLYLALGYYSAFALIWSIAYHRFNFNHLSVFLIAGSFGLVFEQTGGILFSFNPFIYLYVFLVYGSFQASAPALADAGRKMGVWKTVLIGIGVELASFFLASLFIFLLSIPLQ